MFLIRIINGVYTCRVRFGPAGFFFSVMWPLLLRVLMPPDAQKRKQGLAHILQKTRFTAFFFFLLFYVCVCRSKGKLRKRWRKKKALSNEFVLS